MEISSLHYHSEHWPLFRPPFAHREAILARPVVQMEPLFRRNRALAALPEVVSSIW